MPFDAAKASSAPAQLNPQLQISVFASFRMPLLRLRYTDWTLTLSYLDYKFCGRMMPM